MLRGAAARTVRDGFAEAPAHVVCLVKPDVRSKITAAAPNRKSGLTRHTSKRLPWCSGWARPGARGTRQAACRHEWGGAGRTGRVRRFQLQAVEVAHAGQADELTAYLRQNSKKLSDEARKKGALFFERKGWLNKQDAAAYFRQEVAF